MTVHTAQDVECEKKLVNHILFKLNNATAPRTRFSFAEAKLTFFVPTQSTYLYLQLPVPSCSVVDPNTLNLDPDPGIWSNLDPDPGLYYQL